jgi:hypothetical protein
MNNGYQNFNGCGADNEGGEIFNTFFYPKLQSKRVRPLATNTKLNDVSMSFSNCYKLIYIFFLFRIVILKRIVIFVKQLKFIL